MGYYAYMSDILQAEEEIYRKHKEWTDQLGNMHTVLTNFNAVLLGNGSGETVNAICSYINEVHLYLLEKLDVLQTELFDRMLRYAEEFYEIEGDTGTGEIAQESLENQKLVLQNGKENFLLEAEALERNLNQISDIISMSTPSTGTVENGFGELTKYADDLMTAIGEHEEKHMAEDFELMESMLEDLSQLIAGLSGKKQIKIEEFKREELLIYPELYRLEQTVLEMETRRNKDPERVETVTEYIKRVEEPAEDKWNSLVEKVMDTPIGDIYNYICSIASPFLSVVSVVKTVYDLKIREITWEESLKETIGFTKGYNQAVLKMAGETVIGVINLPETLISLGEQIYENGLWETGGAIISSVVAEVSEIWVEDVVNGDAESRGEALGRVAVTVVDFLIGASAVKAAKAAKKAAKAAKKAVKTVENVGDAADTIGDLGRTADDALELVDNIKGGTSTLAQYGDDFGKMGTYVENPNIKVDWTQYAEHAAERMQQRGMTQEMVNNIVENGKVLSQNNGNKFAYITQEGVAIVSKQGKLITAWSSADFDSSMLEIISKLFGE